MHWRRWPKKSFCEHINETFLSREIVRDTVTFVFDTSFKRDKKTPIIIDLRNIYNPTELKNMGFEYYSLGRSIV